VVLPTPPFWFATATIRVMGAEVARGYDDPHLQGAIHRRENRRTCGFARRRAAQATRMARSQIARGSRKNLARERLARSL
jgi:hypothetical protein